MCEAEEAENTLLSVKILHGTVFSRAINRAHKESSWEGARKKAMSRGAILVFWQAIIPNSQ
jgi:hypothetical protein